MRKALVAQAAANEARQLADLYAKKASRLANLHGLLDDMGGGTWAEAEGGRGRLVAMQGDGGVVAADAAAAMCGSGGSLGGRDRAGHAPPVPVQIRSEDVHHPPGGGVEAKSGWSPCVLGKCISSQQHTSLTAGRLGRHTPRFEDKVSPAPPGAATRTGRDLVTSRFAASSMHARVDVRAAGAAARCAPPGASNKRGGAAL
eukprot:scaffold58322_cov67-Phaeocystis_antarctica.AAC.14